MENNNYLLKGYRLKDYEIEGVLGAGGFGVTYLARDIHLKTQVVIKEFLPQEFSKREEGGYSIIPYTDSKENNTYEYLLRKFLKEAQILASIKHPNIVRVFSFFEENNTAYFVMDYISGESLKSYIKRKKTLEEEEILSIVLPLLEGLKEVHRNNYLHRDIAPDNIYLRKNGMSMLIDFGAARNTTRTKSISLASIVKSGYSAPEQYSSNSEQNSATDIYAMGSVLYSMISGKVAPESSIRQMSILNDELDPLEDVRKNRSYQKKYSKALLETIYKAMNIRGKDRFQKVESMQKSMYADVEEKKDKPKRDKPMVDKKKSWAKKIVYTLLFAFTVIGFLGLTGMLADDEEVEQGKSQAIKILDESYSNKPILKKEKMLRNETLKEKCNSGNGEACSLLSKEYFDNNNRTKALAFSKKACDLENGKGCGYYAALCFGGIGVPLNYTKALDASIKACNLDSAEGCLVHGLMYNLEKAGMRSNHEEERKLYDKGLKLSEKACVKNDAESCANLGVIYLLAMGVSRDERKSFAFYQKACDLEDSSSCTALGDFYSDGMFVSKSSYKAEKFYRKGCTLGDGTGCTSLALMVEDEKESLALIQKACNSMYSGAGCFSLGMYHENLNRKDKAKLFYRKSCDLQYEFGCQR